MLIFFIFFFVCCVAFCCCSAEPGSAEPDVTPLSCEYSWVEKRVVRGPTVVYTVGLEHTGHHLWDEKLAPALRMGRGLWTSVVLNRRAAHLAVSDGVDRCEARDEEFERRKQLYVFDAFYPQPTRTIWNETHRALQLDLQQRQPLFVPSCSYPCTLQTDILSLDKSQPKDIHVNPDVNYLARVAEAARVDLRLVVMLRDAVDIVNELNVLRVVVLRDACGELFRQISKIDPRFYTCLDYHHTTLDDPAIGRVADFINVDADALRRATLAHFKRSNRDDRLKLTQASAGVREAFAGLSRCSKTLRDKICGAANQPNETVADRRFRRGGRRRRRNNTIRE